MIIKTLNMGVFQVNNYIVMDETTKDAALIDAGGDYKMTMAAVKELGCNLKYILNTHAHMDHTAGDEELQRNLGIPIYMHKDDGIIMTAFKESLKMFGMPEYEPPEDITFFEDGAEFRLGNLTIKAVHTPGHTKGGVCYLVEDALFCGDTIFFECVGRTDLYGGDYYQLEDSIKNKIYPLGDDIKLYPGHGCASSIKHEKKNNPYFKA
ncbi:MAG: MBL fold metallo-hydrolase [Candidatus Gastranaerophilales bacterium]|nr:MBL fold metallo-hydrolase [Candidatus Gastranaerophilales bacterium]